MKKIFAGILVLVFALTMSGCVYWDGLSESEAREFVEKTLEEKYGEEFVVKQMYLKAGSWDTASDLMADCSPKSDENIVFSTQTLAIGKERVMSDNYIQNVVRKQLKQIIDNVLAEYYENFVSQVFVTPLNYWYDSGIRSVNNATIKNFSESFTNNDDNYTLVYIAIKTSEKDFDNVKNALQKMCNNFYSLNVSLDCYYTDEHTIERCKENIDKSYREIGVTEILRRGNFEMDEFVFFNDGRGLVYIPKDN